MTGVNNGEGLLHFIMLWLPLLHQRSINNFTVSYSDFRDIVVPNTISLATKSPSNISASAVLFEYISWTLIILIN